MKIGDYIGVLTLSLLISVAAVGLASAFHMRVETHLLEEINALKSAQAQQLETIRRLEEKLDGRQPLQQTSWQRTTTAASSGPVIRP